MLNILKENSKLVTNGAALSAIPWIIGDLVTPNDNPVMGALFLTAGFIGMRYDHTQTGVTTHYALSFGAYAAMGIHAYQQGNYSELTSSVGGMLATGKIVADNYGGSWFSRKLSGKNKEENLLPTDPYQQEAANVDFSIVGALKKGLGTIIDTIANTPAEILKTAANYCQYTNNKTMNKFGDDIIELTERPMFKGSLFGAIMDLGYLYSGIVSGDVTKIISGTAWQFGYLMAAPSIPKDGQKHIFVEWYDNIKDKLTKNNNDGNKNTPSFNAGRQPA